jgi:hypothetical protein
MLMNKLKVAAGLVLAVGLAACGAGLWAYQPARPQGSPGAHAAPKGEKLAKGPADKKEAMAKDRALKKAKLDGARKAYEALWAEHDYRGSQAGFHAPSARDWHADQEGLQRWSRRWLEAQTALA